MAWIISWSAMARPNWRRWSAYPAASSSALRARPVQAAAMPMRPAPSPESAIRSPSPSSPSRFATGTRASSKTSSAPVVPRMPIFRSLLPTRNPGVSASTTKAVIPSLPLDRSTVAKTM